jgi:drug/metabolite transporter (DMT)-like permease
MSVRGGADLARLEGHAVGYALATSVFIAGYTLTDGFGARANGDASSYAVWLFVLDGLSMLGLLLARRGLDGLRALRRYWLPGAAGGAMSLGAYWIVIWAMTVAPIALVAALRESSVLFAAALSVLVLREPLTRWRTLAAITIVAGILITRLGQ